MNKRWFILIGLAFYALQASTQVVLPDLNDCVQDHVSIESVLSEWNNRKDTANFCFLNELNTDNLTTDNYALLRDRLLTSYQSRYDSTKYISAINYASFGAALALSKKDTATYLEQLHGIAFTQYRIGNFVDCNIAIQNGLQVSRASRLDYYLAKFLLREARILKAFGKTEEAHERLKENKTIIDTLPANPENWYYYYNNLSILNLSDRDLVAARINGDSAIHYADLTKNEKLIGLSLSWRGLFHAIDTEEDCQLRLDYYQQALVINHRMNDKEQLASNYALVANHYYRTKEWEKSIDYWLISYEYISQMEDKNRERSYYMGMYRTCDSLGLIEKAYEYKLKESELYRELYGFSNAVDIFDLHNKVQQAESENKIRELKYQQQLDKMKSEKQKNNFLIIILSLAIVFGALFYFLSRSKQNQKLQSLLQEKKANQRLLELEKKALRAQMNPHFIFNSLNSIKSYIIKSDPRIAARYLTKFAQLMRIILRNSEEQLVSLSEELKALRLYIELEQFRMQQGFQYEINVDPNIDTEHFQIPPLIIQPYVENAILHGLSNKKDNRKLAIKITQENSKIDIRIIDNGVGRLATSLATSNGKQKSYGMKITRERLEHHIPHKSDQPPVHIKDLISDSGTPVGTEVMIRIPSSAD